ncbi:MAG: hypothetical protein WAT19_07810 [Ferruginibacter sp.]
MENNFYNHDFEQFLRESTADFKMYPSRKVWFCIYNDLHPSRKWPSLAVTLLLVFSILFIGISNNNSINHSRNNSSKSFLATNDAQEKSAGKPQAPAIKNPGASLKSGMASLPTIQHTEAVAGVFTKDVNNTEPAENFITTVTNGAAEQLSEKAASKGITVISAGSDQPGTEAAAKKQELIAAAEAKAKNSFNLKQAVEEKKWIENYAFYNKPAQKRWKSRSAIQFYITPSFGFRSLEDLSKQNINSRSILATSNVSQNINDYVNQTSALNLEVGTMMLYSLSKRLRVKAGVQFNYSSYTSMAEALTHSAQTSILLNEEYGINEMPVNSMYKNSFNPDNFTKLNNKSLQFSMPLGADFKVAGNKRLKFYTGASIQPTLITGGNAYVLSADKKYYVDVPAAMRRFNLNGSLESVLSYTTANGASVIVGPQFRYQFLSTYNKEFNYFEKRYNLGVKVGFTTGF